MCLLGLFYTQNNISRHEIDKMSAQAAHKPRTSRAQAAHKPRTSRAQAAHKTDTISHADILDYMPLQGIISLTWQQGAWHDACHSSECYLSLSVRGAILNGGFGSFECKLNTSHAVIRWYVHVSHTVAEARDGDIQLQE